MWLITTRGFFSVVAHRHDAACVLVRARVRSDLESLEELVPGLGIEHTPRADYEWRAVLPLSEWERVAAVLANEIDYPNFKNAVDAHQGTARAALYAEIWLTLRELQRA